MNPKSDGSNYKAKDRAFGKKSKKAYLMSPLFPVCSHIRGNLDGFLKKYEIYPFSYEYFLGIGVDGLSVAFIAALFFAVLIYLYPPLIFIAFATPLTGSAHYHPRLGLMSAAIMIGFLRGIQLISGTFPASYVFYMILALWSIAQIYIIGYFPGKIIKTSESFRILMKGMVIVAILYSLSEYAIHIVSKIFFGSEVASVLYLFPRISFPMLLIISGIATFIFTNTFCPYMMIPLVSRVAGEQRYCGVGNFVFNHNDKIVVNDKTIIRANMRGFKLISELPSCVVFSCPRGGVVSVYKSGKIYIRKVDRETAERIYKNITSALKDN